MQNPVSPQPDQDTSGTETPDPQAEQQEAKNPEVCIEILGPDSYRVYLEKPDDEAQEPDASMPPSAQGAANQGEAGAEEPDQEGEMCDSKEAMLHAVLKLVQTVPTANTEEAGMLAGHAGAKQEMGL